MCVTGSAGAIAVQHHPTHSQSANAPCPIILSAKSKGSVLAVKLYGSCIPPTEFTAELSGLDLEQLPDLSSSWWLQSIAACCNRLRALPLLVALNVKSLSLAHNCITEVPAALATNMPNLQVCSCCVFCCESLLKPARAVLSRHSCHPRNG